MLSSISTISPRALFTLWWRERWVRGLVILLIPIAMIDSTYTILLSEKYGTDAELNPFGSFLLANDLWILWVVLNISGFSLFCMLTGSYYLHSRYSIKGPDTSILSFLLSIRIGMVAYNLTFYYVESVAAGYPPMWAAFFTTAVSYLIFNKLLSLEYNLSFRWLKAQFQSRFDRLHDRRLVIETAGDNESQSLSEKVQPITSSETTSKQRSVWFKRTGYIALAILSLFITMFVLQFMMELAGIWGVLRTFGWVSLDGGLFLAFFGVILVFVGVSIALIMKAFEVTEDIPS
jgi:hypothetical protein